MKKAIIYVGFIGVTIVGYALMLMATPLAALARTINCVPLARLTCMMFVAGAKPIMQYVDRYDLQCGLYNYAQAWTAIEIVEEELEKGEFF